MSIAVEISWVLWGAVLDEEKGTAGGGGGGGGRMGVLGGLVGTVSGFQVLSSAVSDWFACEAGSFVEFFGEFETEDS